MYVMYPPIGILLDLNFKFLFCTGMIATVEAFGVSTSHCFGLRNRPRCSFDRMASMSPAVEYHRPNESEGVPGATAEATMSVYVVVYVVTGTDVSAESKLPLNNSQFPEWFRLWMVFIWVLHPAQSVRHAHFQI